MPDAHLGGGILVGAGILGWGKKRIGAPHSRKVSFIPAHIFGVTSLFLSCCPVPTAPNPTTPTPPPVNSARPEPWRGAAGHQKGRPPGHARWPRQRPEASGQARPVPRGQGNPPSVSIPEARRRRCAPPQHAPHPACRVIASAAGQAWPGTKKTAVPKAAARGPPPAPRSLLNLFIDALTLYVA